MSSTATPQAPPTENIYGIAKRISLDLEKYPLHTHAAIISVVNTMCQHRKIVLESEMQQEQIAAQEAAMADARRAHAEAELQREQRMAAQMIREGMTPVADAVSKAAVESPKPPRLSIVLDKPGAPSAPSSSDLDAVEAEKDIAMQTALATKEVPAS